MQTADLKQSLDVLKLATATRVIQPILNCVALSGDSMTTTDLDIMITVKGDTGYKGKPVAAPITAIEKVSKNTTSKTVEFFEQALPGVEIKAGKLTTKITGLEAEEFPLKPELENAHSVTFTMEQWSAVINSLGISAASYDTGNILGSIHFSFSPRGFEAASTDGSRLHKVRIEALKTDFLGSINLSAMTLTRFTTKVKKLSDSVTLQFSNEYASNDKWQDYKYNVARITVANVELMIRRSEGQYPNYNQLIPDTEHLKHKVIFDRVEMLARLKELKPFVNERTNILKMHFQWETKTVTMTASIPEASDTESSMGVEYYSDDELKIAFNIEYLIDALKLFSSDTVKLSVNNSLAPAIFTQYVDLEEEISALVMPVQVK